jgi:hypothetical protein
MAESALTVTPPNPTPPTNFASLGATPPNPPNFTKVQYAEPFGARNANGSFVVETPPGVRVNPNPPPYFDDGAAGQMTLFAASAASITGGVGAASGGTENTYPGTGTGVSGGGAVPAATNITHEGSGTELPMTKVIAFGSPLSEPLLDTYLEYAPNTVLPYGPLVTNGAGPVMTQARRDAGPNASHASTLSGTAVPTLTTVAPSPIAAGPGATTLTLTGTNFNRASEVYIAGVKQTVNYVSATSLTITNAMKKQTAGAGNLAVTVVSNGVTTAPVNWAFT